MKKVTLVIIAIMMCLWLILGIYQEVNKQGESSFKKESINDDLRIYVDKETGVNYII